MTGSPTTELCSEIFYLLCYHIQTKLKAYSVDASYNECTRMQANLSPCNCLSWTGIDLNETSNWKKVIDLWTLLRPVTVQRRRVWHTRRKYVLTWRYRTTQDDPNYRQQHRRSERATAVENKRSNPKGRGVVGQYRSPDNVRKTTISGYQRKCHRDYVSRARRKADIFFTSW